MKASGNRLKYKLFIAIIAALVLVYLVNGFFAFRISGITNEKMEENRPAKVDMVILPAHGCENCYDVSAPLAPILSSDLLEFISQRQILPFSDEGQKLIKTWKIERLPAVVITGETEKENVKDVWTSNWRQSSIKEKTARILVPGPPYIDVAANTTKGLVSYTLISGCDECASYSYIITFLNSAGIKFSEEREINYQSAEAKELIQKFSINKVPAIIITNNVLDYEGVRQSWSSFKRNTILDEHAVETIQPPYLNLSSGKVAGLVEVTYINISSCADCYDVTVHKEILQRFGVIIVKEIFLDATSEKGIELIKKYNIEKAPTVLFSSEANVYASLDTVWQQVGTIESDGTYVFRNVDSMGKAVPANLANGRNS